MGQLTVNDLFKDLKAAVEKGYGNHKIIISDDNEGNGYHGMFFGITITQVKESIKASNGLYDSEETNPEKLVILG